MKRYVPSNVNLNSSLANELAEPKSANLIALFFVIKIFSGLISLCKIGVGLECK